MKVDLIHFGVSSVLLLCLLSDNSAGTCVGIGAREKRRENYIKTQKREKLLYSQEYMRIGAYKTYERKLFDCMCEIVPVYW